MKVANTLLLSIALTGMSMAAAFAQSTQPAVQSTDAAPAADAVQPATKPGTPLTKPEVAQRLASQGYTRVEDLEFHNGLWQAKARSADGKDVKVKVDPSSGEVVPDKAVSQVGEDDIRASLASAGYTDTHDVKLHDGLWEAKARNPEGRKVKLHLSTKDASIVSIDGK